MGKISDVNCTILTLVSLSCRRQLPAINYISLSAIDKWMSLENYSFTESAPSNSRTLPSRVYLQSARDGHCTQILNQTL